MHTDTKREHKIPVPTRREPDENRPITGPHEGYDRDGTLDHRYYRCERCGLESTDPHLLEGCFRCNASEGDEDQGTGDGRG